MSDAQNGNGKWSAGQRRRWNALTPEQRTKASAALRDGATTALNRRLVEDYGLSPERPDFEERLAEARKRYFSFLGSRRRPAQ
jgi:hypothetical protein